MRLAALLVFALLPSCVVGTEQRPSRVEAQTPPPPPAEQRSAGELVADVPPTPNEPPRGAAPSADAAWVPGYWHWDGVRYVWIAGHWEREHPLWAP